MSTKFRKAALLPVVFLICSCTAGADDLSLRTDRKLINTKAKQQRRIVGGPEKKPSLKKNISRTRNVHLYNTRIQAKFDPGAILKCDGQEEPSDFDLLLNSDEAEILDADWGLRLTGINLKYVAGKFPGTFDIERTLFLQTDSEQLQRSKVIGGGERHGCDEEVYSAGSQFDTSNDEIGFTSNVFVAKRVCVNRYLGGRAAVCSAESTLAGGARFKVRFSQSYDECKNGGRSNAALEIVSINQIPPQGGRTANCLGVSVDNIPILTGLLTNLGVGIVTKLVLDNNTHVPQASLPPLALHQVVRPKNDGVTVCPLRVETHNQSPTRVQIATTEGMRNMVAGFACKLYRNHERAIMLYAETLAPTKAVTVQTGDTYWGVAHRLWGDGRLYPLIQRANTWKKTLGVGAQIEVPRLAQVLSDPQTLRDGDTLWDAAIRLKGDPSGFVSLQRKIKPSIDNPDLVYPFWIIESAPPK